MPRAPASRGYSGGLDYCGKPHGRGTHKIAGEGVSFCGQFSHGNKHGRGCLYFEDGSSLKGKWVNDELDGIGVYSDADGSIRENTYSEGSCTGPGKEFDPDGYLVFDGMYKDGARHGRGEEIIGNPAFRDGRFVGYFEDGEVTGVASFFIRTTPNYVEHGNMES
jgi:hypothetical protein